MTRSEILTEVEAMIFARLFGKGRWLADRETAAILGRKLEQMALEERVDHHRRPDDIERHRCWPEAIGPMELRTR